MKKLLLFLSIALPLVVNSQELGNGVTDVDGNKYTTVKIGIQEWTQQNLNVSHYRNGDPITEASSANELYYMTTGGWIYYNKETSNGVIYGKLYNWNAVNDPRGLAPEGYHIPTEVEINNLFTFLGGANVAGGKLKEEGTSHWLIPNNGATNESGFTALPGGACTDIFSYLGKSGHWWTSTEFDNTNSVAYGLQNDLSYSYSGNDIKGIGRSIRCISNTAVLANNNFNKQLIKLYPNPSKSQLYIILPSEFNYADYKINNIEGKLLKTGNLNDVNSSINVSELQSGIYFICISKDNYFQTLKFIKK